MQLINKALVYRYWPEAEQCFWLKRTYHHTLAQCCLHVPYNSHLHEAMMNYNPLDILQIQSFEDQLREFKSGHKSNTSYFELLGDNVLCFQRANVSGQTNKIPSILTYPFCRHLKALISMTTSFTYFTSNFNLSSNCGHLQALGWHFRT